MFETTTDGILVVDKFGKEEMHNEKFAEMWRIPAKTFEAKRVEVLLDYILPQLTEPDKYMSVIKELFENPEQSCHDTISFIDGRVYERNPNPVLEFSRCADRTV